jgi:hypothetical protein
MSLAGRVEELTRAQAALAARAETLMNDRAEPMGGAGVISYVTHERAVAHRPGELADIIARTETLSRRIQTMTDDMPRLARLLRRSSDIGLTTSTTAPWPSFKEAGGPAEVSLFTMHLSQRVYTAAAAWRRSEAPPPPRQQVTAIGIAKLRYSAASAQPIAVETQSAKRHEAAAPASTLGSETSRHGVATTKPAAKELTGSKTAMNARDAAKATSHTTQNEATGETKPSVTLKVPDTRELPTVPATGAAATTAAPVMGQKGLGPTKMSAAAAQLGEPRPSTKADDSQQNTTSTPSQPSGNSDDNAVTEQSPSTHASSQASPKTNFGDLPGSKSLTKPADGVGAAGKPASAVDVTTELSATAPASEDSAAKAPSAPAAKTAFNNSTGFKSFAGSANFAAAGQAPAASATKTGVSAFSKPTGTTGAAATGPAPSADVAADSSATPAVPVGGGDDAATAAAAAPASEDPAAKAPSAPAAKTGFNNSGFKAFAGSANSGFPVKLQRPLRPRLALAHLASPWVQREQRRRAQRHRPMLPRIAHRLQPRCP